MTAVETKQRHQPCEIRHRDDIDWETIRWPGETGKMLFHPRPERPTTVSPARRPEDVPARVQ